MWIQKFLFQSLLTLAVRAQDQACAEGTGLIEYADGRFDTPNGNTPTFSVGTEMNIRWTTVYDASTLWLIVGCDFAHPAASLATGILETSFTWTIETTSTNSSQVYLFRVVDAGGSVLDQRQGGFVSAPFMIAGGPSSSKASSSTTIAPSLPSQSNIGDPASSVPTTTSSPGPLTGA